MLIYNLYPLLAGSLNEWRPHIQRAAAMGFEWIYVNPIHVPGQSGSIYSVFDYFHINPLLLDPNDSRSGEEQFREIADYAKELGLRMMADLVLNHCAVDSPLTRTRSKWFIKGAGDCFEQPYCMNNGEMVVWSDLVKFAHTDSSYGAGFYSFTLKVADYLNSLGFEGFRCDAAYQIPAYFWTRFIGDVKKKHANSVFVAETLGCSITDVRQTAISGFDMVCNSAKWWDYEGTWLLQQHDLIPDAVPTLGFPENHDTERIYNGTELSVNIMKQRSLFTAFFSAAWLIPIGFEFGFSRRIRVTRTRVSDWEETNIDLREFIGRINRIKKRHAVLSEDGLVRVLISPNPNILLLWKSTVNATEEALLVLNKDIYNSQYFEVGSLGSYMQFAKELEEISPEFSLGTVGLGYFSYELGPGQALILVGGS